MPAQNTKDNIKPFAPPSPDALETPEQKEARETAEKVVAGKLVPVGYTVAHERVGSHGNMHDGTPGLAAWVKDRRLSAKEVRDHFQGDPDADALIERLVSLGALVPFYE
jgi:hypothetical protein